MIDMKDIQPEHMYEAARPRPVGRSEKYYNDRYVILVEVKKQPPNLTAGEFNRSE